MSLRSEERVPKTSPGWKGVAFIMEEHLCVKDEAVHATTR